MTERGANPKLVALLVLLAVAFVYLMVLRPQSARLAEAREEREQLTAELDRLDALALSSGARDVAAIGPALSAAVPATPEISGLLRRLDAVASETGMTQSAITPSGLSVNPSGPGGSIQVSLTASGPRAAADAYLRRLATLDRLVVVEQMSMQVNDPQLGVTPPPAVEGAGAATVQLQVSGRVFTALAPVADVEG